MVVKFICKEQTLHLPLGSISITQTPLPLSFVASSEVEWFGESELCGSIALHSSVWVIVSILVYLQTVFYQPKKNMVYVNFSPSYKILLTMKTP